MTITKTKTKTLTITKTRTEVISVVPSESVSKGKRGNRGRCRTGHSNQCFCIYLSFKQFHTLQSHYREDYHILPSHVGEGQGWGQYSEFSADDLRLQTPPLTPPLEGRGVICCGITIYSPPYREGWGWVRWGWVFFHLFSGFSSSSDEWK